jgi:hypothetical protein
LDGFLEISGKSDIGEDFQIRRTQKLQAGFSLDFPNISICIDDTISWDNSQSQVASLKILWDNHQIDPMIVA